MMQSQPQLSRLALASFMALLGSSQLAMAAPTLMAASTATANAVAGTTTVSSTPGVYQGSYSNASDTLGNGNSTAWTNANGAYYVGSQAEGIGSATALTSFATSFVNNTGITQLYSVQFHIYGGSISTSLAGGQSLTGGETLSSSYAASFKLNGVEIWSSAASINRTASGITHSKTGIDLNSGDDGSDGFYSWSGGYYTVELGAFAAGATINIEAIVQDDAFANVGTYVNTGGGGYGCYGGGEPTNGGGAALAAIGQGQCFKGSSSAGYGDPIEINGGGNGSGSGQTLPGGQLPFDPTATPVNAVPEPGSLALAALGLLAAGAARRRQRKAD